MTVSTKQDRKQLSPWTAIIYDSYKSLRGESELTGFFIVELVNVSVGQRVIAREWQRTFKNWLTRLRTGTYH